MKQRKPDSDYYDILTWPVLESPSGYRGIERFHPAFDETLPHEAPVNQAFYRHVEAIHGYGAGSVLGLPLNESIEAAQLFRSEGQNVEVVRIQIVRSDDAQDIRTRSGSGFLGFEAVNWIDHSLLQLFLEDPPDLSFPDKPLSDLIRLYFAPRRNQYMLFEDWEDARLFTDVIRAYNTLAPNLFEPEIKSVIETICLTRVWPEPEAVPSVG